MMEAEHMEQPISQPPAITESHVQLQVLWNLIFATALQFGVAVVQLKLTSCKKCRTVLHIL